MAIKSKQKFGIDSKYYAYGKKSSGEQSRIRYSYLQNSRNNPLESLKKIMVHDGWDVIKIYNNPYDSYQKPFLMWTKERDWFTPDFTKQSSIFIKLWIKPFHDQPITEIISYTTLDGVSRKAVEILKKKYFDYREYKFARLYFNAKDVNEQLYHYEIEYRGIRQVVREIEFNKVRKMIETGVIG